MSGTVSSEIFDSLLQRYLDLQTRFLVKEAQFEARLEEEKRKTDQERKNMSGTVSSESYDSLLQRYLDLQTRFLVKEAQFEARLEEEKRKTDQEREKRLRDAKKIIKQESEIRNKTDKLNTLQRGRWRVMPRPFIDDIENFYKHEYDAASTRPKVPRNSGPKARRIKRRESMWNWFFRNSDSKPEIDHILKELNKEFRKIHDIRSTAKLSSSQKLELENFHESVSSTIANVYEYSSFVIPADVGIQLLADGELESMNLFGDEIDPYLIPFMRAVVPIIDPSKPIATFT